MAITRKIFLLGLTRDRLHDIRAAGLSFRLLSARSILLEYLGAEIFPTHRKTSIKEAFAVLA